MDHMLRFWLNGRGHRSSSIPGLFCAARTTITPNRAGNIVCWKQAICLQPFNYTGTMLKSNPVLEMSRAPSGEHVPCSTAFIPLEIPSAQLEVAPLLAMQTTSRAGIWLASTMKKRVTKMNKHKRRKRRKRDRLKKRQN